MLQFALLPSITGFGSAHALLADSGSRNVTCYMGQVLCVMRIKSNNTHVAVKENQV